MKWNERAANRMLLAGTKKRVNTSSVIVRRKVPKAAETFSSTVKGRRKGRRKACVPAGNVLDMAAAMGIEPLTEEQYRELQKLGSFDTKTQSWLKTPG